MHFSVLTIFPELFDAFFKHGIVGRALKNKLISSDSVNIRGFAAGKHRVTDDRPYGGGCGMLFKPEPLAQAIRASRKALPSANTVLLTPQGRPFNQQLAEALVSSPGLILVCGRYEGVDERICQEYIDYEISIGDYVMTGGELAAMVVIDAITRLIPGVLGGAKSAQTDSFAGSLLEHAHYTRPRVFENMAVPDVLVSGHHKFIENWRLETALIRTFLKRRDLLTKRVLDEKEVAILKRWRVELDDIINAHAARCAGSLSGDQ
jgi:tRNA (guanine37-N1)-methyltransferase